MTDLDTDLLRRALRASPEPEPEPAFDPAAIITRGRRLRWRRRAAAAGGGVCLAAAVFGAVVGVVIGTALGIALASSLRHNGVTNLAVPFESLILFLILSALLGLLAATWPARRAANLDVLAAIATE